MLQTKGDALKVIVSNPVNIEEISFNKVLR